MRQLLGIVAALLGACSAETTEQRADAALIAALTHVRAQQPWARDLCVHRSLDSWVSARRIGPGLRDDPYPPSFLQLAEQADYMEGRVIQGASIAGFPLRRHREEGICLGVSGPAIFGSKAVLHVGTPGVTWRNLWLEEDDDLWRVVAETKRAGFE